MRLTRRSKGQHIHITHIHPLAHGRGVVGIIFIVIMNTIPCMLYPVGAASASAKLDIAKNADYLRPVMQLAQDLERRRKEAGASRMIAERGLDCLLLSDSGVKIGPFKQVVYDLSRLRAPHVTFRGAGGTTLLIELTEDVASTVISQDGSCLWCCMPRASGCGICNQSVAPAMST